jgi:hypothetical protein
MSYQDEEYLASNYFNIILQYPEKNVKQFKQIFSELVPILSKFELCAISRPLKANITDLIIKKELERMTSSRSDEF